MTSNHADLVRAQIQRELDDLQGSARPVDGQSFAADLMRTQTSDRIETLKRELAGLDEEAFELAFSEKRADAHQLSTTVLSNLLGRFQRAVTFAGWARIAGPGVSGNVPAIVSRAFETQVNAFAPGSFKVELQAREEALENVALHDALTDFLTLASSAAENDDAPEPSQDVRTLAQDLGPEATKRFALFFAKLREAELQARFEWATLPEAAVVLLPAQSGKLAAWLKSVEEEIDSVIVTGLLSAADAIEGRFAITASSGEVYEGKAARELLTDAVIERMYTVQMRVTRYRSVMTRAETSRAVLESLTPVDD